MLGATSMMQRFAALAKERALLRSKDHGNTVALHEAIQWIFRAQDATSDRGVSHSYLIGRGWSPSYPETTGYIIPTLLNWSHLSGDPEARRRAIEMAEWETTVQLPDGSVQASVMGSVPPKPAVFNTGQAIFGWIGAYRSTGQEGFIGSATKAARWLICELGNDPVWSRHGSMGAPMMHTFNVRTAWAVILLAETVSDPGLATPMRRVLTWALEQEETPGWFRHNCLNDQKHPLLHTIAYSAQGFLESGTLLGEEPWVLAAQRTAHALAKTVRDDGWMPARYDSNFERAASYCCLTGLAQMSIVWRRLCHLSNSPEFTEASLRVNNYLRRTQDVQSGNPGIRGGINGSRPVNGAYGRYRVLNWATKFFIDALMFEEYAELMHSSDYSPG